MKKIGILTFHASYNHGTVFQAQATQMIIEKLGYNATIVDYRPSTYDRYEEIYINRNRKGIRSKVLAFAMTLLKKERKVRIERFNQYINDNLKLSKQRIYTYKELKNINNDYDIFISGSDQIWSKSVPEIELSGEETVLGYYLGFTNKRKISYASSIASMQEKDLLEFKNLLNEYSALSTREKIGVEKIKNVTGREVELVVDPTFLINKKEWLKFAKDQPIVKEPYVLLYSLKTYKAEKNWEKALKQFSNKHKLKIVVVAPYFELKMSGAINMVNAGPNEFLNLYNHAKVICTDTFHGTAFAVNFNKPFYSLGTKYWSNDIRKTSLLKSLHLENRLIDDEQDINLNDNYFCDFTEANIILNEKINASIEFLKNALTY